MRNTHDERSSTRQADLDEMAFSLRGCIAARKQCSVTKHATQAFPLTLEISVRPTSCFIAQSKSRPDVYLKASYMAEIRYLIRVCG